MTKNESSIRGEAKLHEDHLRPHQGTLRHPTPHTWLRGHLQIPRLPHRPTTHNERRTPTHTDQNQTQTQNPKSKPKISYKLKSETKPRNQEYCVKIQS